MSTVPNTEVATLMIAATRSTDCRRAPIRWFWAGIFNTHRWRTSMPTSLTGKLADPAWRRERARKAVAARNSLENHLRHVTASADQLTPAQRQQLRAALEQEGAKAK